MERYFGADAECVRAVTDGDWWGRVNSDVVWPVVVECEGACAKDMKS